MYFWRVINLLCFLLLLFIFLSLFLNLFLYLTYISIPFNVGLYARVDVLILFCLYSFRSLQKRLNQSNSLGMKIEEKFSLRGRWRRTVACSG